jgi:aminocarboxymuconate-semialdehyde decarboxylase
MRIIDSFPLVAALDLKRCAGARTIRAEPNRSGGYDYRAGQEWRTSQQLAEWFTDKQLEWTAWSSGGRCVLHRPVLRLLLGYAGSGRARLAMMRNRDGGAQRKYPGRVCKRSGAAAGHPDRHHVLDHAITELGLMGVNMPGSVGGDPRIDESRAVLRAREELVCPSSCTYR